MGASKLTVGYEYRYRNTKGTFFTFIYHGQNSVLTTPREIYYNNGYIGINKKDFKYCSLITYMYQAKNYV